MINNYFLVLLLAFVSPISFINYFSPSKTADYNDAPSDKTAQLVEVVSTFSQNEYRLGDEATLLLSVRNNTGIQIENLSIQILSEGLVITNSKVISPNLMAYTLDTAIFQIQAEKAGDYNLQAIVTYEFTENGTTQVYSLVDELSVNFAKRMTFNWPEYLIPLVVGFIFAQIATIISEDRKKKTERASMRENSISVGLALLKTSTAAIKFREPIEIDVWNQIVLKGNLYHALYELNDEKDRLDLTTELSQILVQIADYNTRYKLDRLDDDFADDLTTTIEKLIAKLNIIDKQ